MLNNSLIKSLKVLWLILIFAFIFPLMAQLNKIPVPLAYEGKIQIGKLWTGNDDFPYTTNFGYIGYMDYPGGSEDYYVSLFSLILSGNTATQQNIVVDLGANTSSGSGVNTFGLQRVDPLQEDWDLHDSDDSHIFWEANASFNGNPWNLRLNTKLRAWGLEDYDDFVIIQYTFTNTGTTDITDFWLASSMPAECGEKTVENRNLDDIVVFDSQTGLAYMHDDDSDNGLSPYWLGQVLIKAVTAGGTSDDVETSEQIWNTLHYYRWDNIPNSREALYTRIRESVSGDVETAAGVWDVFSGVGPYTIKAGGDLEFTICYIYGIGEEISSNLTNARSLLENDFSIPAEVIPPPTPILDEPEVNGPVIEITWSGEQSELQPDFAGYQLYKSDLSPNGPWRLLFQDPVPPVRAYQDRAQVGYKNYYAISAYDTDGNESSIWSTKSKTSRGIEAATFPESSLDKILVIPNPYIGNATWEVNDYENKILFSRLPEKCTIYIYSLSADLVDIVYHNVDGDLTPDANATGDESWDLMSQNDQAVVSGLYVFVVVTESGEKATGRFAIIKGEK